MSEALRLLRLAVAGRDYRYAPLAAAGKERVARAPRTRRILAENLLRHGEAGVAADVLDGKRVPMSFRPVRLIMQDLLGLPLLVDMVALRRAVAATGGDPARVNPAIPVDIVVDHSMTLMHWASPDARARNERTELESNRERFQFLRWCETGFERFRVVPPGKGIVHQVNLEHLSGVVTEIDDGSGEAPLLAPDTLVGTDSHTPMINGIGVLGWGVGGFEAEGVMLGRTITFQAPRVVGVRLVGRLRPGAVATDLALTMTERLRRLGVVEAFVEFHGPGLATLSVPDRATVANMCPEYGATAAYFPIDRRTIAYLVETGRGPAAEVAEAYAKAQQLWADDGEADAALGYDETIEVDLSAIGASVAGPSRPQDRMEISAVPSAMGKVLDERQRPRPRDLAQLTDGAVVIAAITSCTNTANPHAMLAAGLLARNARARGLLSRPWVKTSLAPGSAAVAGYLARAGLQEHLDALGFNIAGFACVTCNGMSGPLAPEIEQAITSNGLACAAVLSGNRNFAGRIHPLAPASFLASPALVVAYALAGSTLIDLEHDPLGTDSSGAPVRLADLWPDPNEVARLVAETITPDLFSETRAHLFEGSPDWQALPTAGTRTLYDFGQDSTYLGDPPYFSTPAGSTGVTTIRGLRPLAILGDQITTDHIAPVGHIPETSPAGRYLIARGITPRDFNSYGTRRAQPDVVVRSVFANIRLRNEMVGGQEGGLTRLEPGGEVMAIYDAAERYRDRGEASIVIAGRDYGSGSSRDTAARACLLAGIRAVVAESFERIHRTNLINAGILPCELPAGTTRKTLRLDGTETFDLEDLPAAFADALACTLVVRRADGATDRIAVHLRADTAEELETLRAGGLLPSIAGELGVH